MALDQGYQGQGMRCMFSDIQALLEDKPSSIVMLEIALTPSDGKQDLCKQSWYRDFNKTNAADRKLHTK